MKYIEMTKEQLLAEQAALTARYEQLKAKGLKLDMSRGKPSSAQLDLSMEMLDVLKSDSVCKSKDGFDVRNYGLLDGIIEAKKLFAELLGCGESEVLVYGNSSLNLMYDTLMRGFVFGIRKGAKPYSTDEKRKWLCPVPGYDRHFAITEQLGFEMISIPVDENGPDMDMIEKLVAEDASIKGIWCVPVYSNPGGVVYSDETVKRLASLKPAADNFAILYDNAYVVHPLYSDFVEQLNLLETAKAVGNGDMIYAFTSTSKISFAGAGISAMSASEANIAYHKKIMSIQTIGHDKLNQLRHVRYFKNAEGIRAHMKKHADIMRPKFESVLSALETEIGGTGTGSWMKPTGGYFISFDAMEGCAKRIVSLCKEAGVVLTGAGAAFPYGIDPDDSNIRIAPSFPPPSELVSAMEVFCVAVKLAAAEKLLKGSI